MKCKEITKKGRRCAIDAEPGSDICHIHDPQGTYQRQRRGEVPMGQAKGRRVDKPSILELPSDPQALLWADGLAEPNPGRGCFGWIARSRGGVIGSGHGFVGERVTSNEAEYRALIEALRWAAGQGLKDVVVQMDSKLVVKQVRGSWRCKSENLWPLLSLAWELAEKVRAFVAWIPREQNIEADALSRQAYEANMTKPRAIDTTRGLRTTRI